MIGPMGAMHGFLGHAHHGMHHFHDQLAGHDKEHLIPLSHLMTVPNSAGDNNAAIDKSSALPPSVTALFNSAAMGGSNACKWKPHLDCSVETLESSYFSNSGRVYVCTDTLFSMMLTVRMNLGLTPYTMFCMFGTGQ